MARPWFRMYRGILSSPKIQRLAPDAFKFWVNCLAMTDDDGFLPAIDDIAYVQRVTEAVAKGHLRTLTDARLVDAIKGRFKMHDWQDHQRSTDVSTERVKQFRKRKVKRDETVSETALEEKREEEKREEEKELKGASAPPEPLSDDEEGLGSDDAAAVANYWNNIAEEHGLAVVRRLTDGRRKKINLRLSEAGGLRGMAQIIDMIPSQPFLLGQNDRKWKVDFDWILEPANLVKLEERKYANGHA